MILYDLKLTNLKFPLNTLKFTGLMQQRESYLMRLARRRLWPLMQGARTRSFHLIVKSCLNGGIEDREWSQPNKS